MSSIFDRLPMPSDESMEYSEALAGKLLGLVGVRRMDSLETLFKLSLLSEDNRDLPGLILGCIVYGYTLKEDEIMTTEKHKFSADDFLGENK